MSDKITIEFDVENKVIGKVDGTKNIGPVDIAKVLMSVALSSLSKVSLKPANKIIQPDKKILHHSV
jgi:hypothetical protein